MASKDRIGGYTLDELLGSKPIGSTEQKKPGVVARVVGAPFRLVAVVAKAPFIVIGRLGAGLANALGEVVRLPIRIVGAIARPWRTKQ